MADAMLRRLKCDNDTRETVTTLIQYHSHPEELGRKALRRLLIRLGEQQLRLLFDVWRADAAAHTPEACAQRLPVIDREEHIFSELLAEGSCTSVRDLAIGGRELLSLGIPSGPGIGRVLNALLEEVTDESLPNEREALLRRAEEIKGGI